MTVKQKVMGRSVEEALGVEHFDANETAMYQRALEYIKAEPFNVEYANFVGRTIVPVSSDVDPGAESVVYQSYNMIGEAKIVSHYADDLPLADLVASETNRRVVTLADAYHYSVFDMRKAIRSGMSLPEGRGMAARRALEQKLEKLIAFGSSAHNIPGLTAYPSVPVVSGGGTAWASATDAQILSDIRLLKNSITTGTQNIHRVTKLIVPNAIFEILSFKLISNTSMSILQWLRDPANFGLEVAPWEAFATAGGSSSTRIMAGQFERSIIRTEITEEITQEPAQWTNLAAKVPMHMRTTGVVANYPLAFAYMDGR